MADDLPFSSFAENLNTKFLMHAGASTPIEVEMIEATQRRSTSRQEQFSLLFRAPVDSPLQQNLYRLDHEKLGTLDLLLVPVARDAQGVYYEAVFNRLIQPGA